MKKYSEAYLTKLFEKFYEKHTRATDYFCEMYGVTTFYCIHSLLIFESRYEKPNWKLWYYFKKSVKLLETYLKQPKKYLTNVELKKYIADYFWYAQG